MEASEQASAEAAPPSSEELRAKLAARIREDSEKSAELTPARALADFFAGMTPEEAEPVLVDLLNDARYADIKALTTSDELYFYSDEYLEPPTAEDQVLSEEAMFRLATTIRRGSKDTARLTPAADLVDVLADLELESADPYLHRLLEDERYQDIRAIATAGGVSQFYSERYITEAYARLLARTEGGDPCATIAETVRDESRIYPRPTDVRLFLHPPFNMDRDEMLACVAELLQREEFGDIKKIEASTGAIYLHSEKHLGGAHARSLVEWEEVGQFENP